MSASTLSPNWVAETGAEEGGGACGDLRRSQLAQWSLRMAVRNKGEGFPWLQANLVNSCAVGCPKFTWTRAIVRRIAAGTSGGRPGKVMSVGRSGMGTSGWSAARPAACRSSRREPYTNTAILTGLVNRCFGCCTSPKSSISKARLLSLWIRKAPRTV